MPLTEQSKFSSSACLAWSYHLTGAPINLEARLLTAPKYRKHECAQMAFEQSMGWDDIVAVFNVLRSLSKKRAWPVRTEHVGIKGEIMFIVSHY